MESTNTNSYQLKQGDDNYILSITILDQGIKISCDDSKGLIYSKEFTLEDIISLDDIFSNCQSNYDFIDIFDNILKQEKVRVEEESGLLQIVLFIASLNKEIQIILEKEGGVETNIQEQKGFDEGQMALQMGENADMGNVDYTQGVENTEAGLDNIEANVDTNLNVNINEMAQNDIQQTSTTEQTNDLGGFNLDDVLLNKTVAATTLVQNDNNTNFENMNNAELINAENNFAQEATNEFSNINININQEANITDIPQVTENLANVESYENIINTNQTNQTTTTELNLPTEAKKEEANYDLPVANPEIDLLTLNQTVAQTQYQTEPQIITQTQNVENVDYSSQIMNKATTTTTTTKTTRNVEVSLPKKSTSQFRTVSLSLPKDKKSEEEEKRINKLKGEQISLKNQNAQFNSKILELTNLINSYKTKISILESQRDTGEINALRAENQRIKQQLEELKRLRAQVAEAQLLRNQLNEYNSLKEKAAQVDAIKTQLLELNSIKMKIAQLSGLKDSLGDINTLKQNINLYNAQSQASNLGQYQTEKTEVVTKTKKAIIKGDIIHNLNELEMITRKINRANNKITLNLLYKATADSDSAMAFHQRCDRAESSLVLIETNKGKRFGGFTSTNWRGDCIDKEDDDAFIFSLDLMKTYDIIKGENAIGCYPTFGPIFMGCQIRIFDNAFEKGGTTFEKDTNYETEEDFELTGGEQNFGVKEIEVYEVIVE